MCFCLLILEQSPHGIVLQFARHRQQMFSDAHEGKANTCLYQLQSPLTWHNSPLAAKLPCNFRRCRSVGCQGSSSCRWLGYSPATMQRKDQHSISRILSVVHLPEQPHLQQALLSTTAHSRRSACGIPAKFQEKHSVVPFLQCGTPSPCSPMGAASLALSPKDLHVFPNSARSSGLAPPLKSWIGFLLTIFAKQKQ